LHGAALDGQPPFAEFNTDRLYVISGSTLDEQKILSAGCFVGGAEFIAKYHNAVTAAAFVEAELPQARAGRTEGSDLSDQRDGLISVFQAKSGVNTSRAVMPGAVSDTSFGQADFNKCVGAE